MEYTEKAPHTLFSFVLDNSASVTDDRLGAWISAFRAFTDEVAGNSAFSFELVLFDALEPTVAKSFDDAVIAPVSGGRFPLFAPAVTLACERLTARAQALAEAGEAVHRPCLFILTDGFTVDETEATARYLDGLERDEQLQYLPFALSDAPLCERVAPFDRIKHIIPIAEGGISGFFGFVKTLLAERATQAAGEPLRLSRNDFEGWALL